MLDLHLQFVAFKKSTTLLLKKKHLILKLFWSIRLCKYYLKISIKASGRRHCFSFRQLLLWGMHLPWGDDGLHILQLDRATSYKALWLYDAIRIRKHRHIKLHKAPGTFYNSFISLSRRERTIKEVATTRCPWVESPGLGQGWLLPERDTDLIRMQLVGRHGWSLFISYET